MSSRQLSATSPVLDDGPVLAPNAFDPLPRAQGAGETIARVVRIRGPLWTGWRSYRAVALDSDGRVIELRPGGPPDGAGWLACVGGQVVGRAALPLQAVRTAEAALAGA